MQTAENIIIFDGVCNFCNGFVQFVIRHDPKGKFHFTTLQGETGKSIQRQFHIDETVMNSFVLIQNGKAYTKSTASVLVARELSGWIQSIYVFRIVPPFLRDAVYDLVSNNRYRWFGKKEECMIPTPDLQKRFLP